LIQNYDTLTEYRKKFVDDDYLCNRLSCNIIANLISPFLDEIKIFVIFQSNNKKLSL